MMKIAYSLTLLSAILACALYAAPAQARARVFVASYGNDANPCTFGSPCKTFQHAVDVVDDGGEVTAIDSAGFGPINIAKSVTITSPDGVEAGIVASPGSPAIAIDTASDVFLRGLTIEGNNSGTDGISLTGTGPGTNTLGIVHCVIRHFTHDGIYLQPSGTLLLSILDTIASNNGNDGIDLSPAANVGLIEGVIDHSTAVANVTDGMNVWGANLPGGGGGAFITIVNSVSANNGGNGFRAITTDAPTVVFLRDTTAAYNQGFGINVEGSASMTFAHVSVTGANGISIDGIAHAFTFGDNHVDATVSGTASSLKQF
jgi:hypothetical protein